VALRELSSDEYSKIKPLIKASSYGLKNHSIFSTYDGAVNCVKPISLNGSPYKGTKNKGTTHIKDIVKLPDGSFALASKTFCMDAGIAYSPNDTYANNVIQSIGHVEQNSVRSTQVNSANTSNHIQRQQTSTNLNLNDNLIQRSQIGAASVGNVNVNIHQKNYSWLIAVVLIFFVLLFILLK